MPSNVNPKFLDNLNQEKPIRHLDTEQFNAGKDFNANRKSLVPPPGHQNSNVVDIKQQSSPNNYNSEDKNAGLNSKKKDACLIW